MKNHFEHFQAFIEEQKKWFEQHLSADFAQTWNDHIWVYKVLNILGVEISLSSAPLSTYTNPANFVEKEFDSPARREEW